MKKMFLFLFLLLMPNLCYSEETYMADEQNTEVSYDETSEAVESAISYEFLMMAKKMTPAYENLKRCKPTINEYIQIEGIKNELCHFKYVNYDCVVPMGVAKEYGELGLRFMRKFFNGNYGVDTPENARIQKILSDPNYCTKN